METNNGQIKYELHKLVKGFRTQQRDQNIYRFVTR
jgi:hypothetical protein